jgi:hypothetical protein
MAPGGGPAEGAGEPSRVITQDYRTLGRQVVFFASGAFKKGSLRVATNTPFGGEFGFIGPNRHHRLVEIYDEAGRFDQLVLIREFRSGSGAAECAPTTAELLPGTWTGQTAKICADWPEPDIGDSRLEIGPGRSTRCVCCPMGASAACRRRSATARRSWWRSAGCRPPAGWSA